jgi:hypothetical protein
LQRVKRAVPDRAINETDEANPLTPAAARFVSGEVGADIDDSIPEFNHLSSLQNDPVEIEPPVSDGLPLRKGPAPEQKGAQDTMVLVKRWCLQGE